MKVAILSDIHDNIPNLEKCFDWCKANAIQTAICCGDVTNNDTLKMVNDFFSSGVYLVQGNMEIYDEQETGSYSNIKYLGKYGVAEIDNKIFGACHEPMYLNKTIELCGQKGGCNFIFYGHTHQPWEEIRQEIKVINPGTVAGTFSHPTFAVWDIETGKIELKLIDNL